MTKNKFYTEEDGKIKIKLKVILILLCASLCFLIIGMIIKYNGVINQYNGLVDKQNELIEQCGPCLPKPKANCGELIYIGGLFNSTQKEDPPGPPQEK